MSNEEKTIYQELSEERKSLQDQGLLPEWFATSGWQLLKARYLTDKDRNLKDIYTRVSKAAAAHTEDPDIWEPRFFNILWKGYLALSTPVISNLGTNRGCPVSCSGSYVGDSIYDFYSSQLEAALLSKNGFGTSSYLGDIRPRGSKMSAGGYASGILPVLKGFIQVARDVSQGNQRRGSWAGYIPIDHEDFWEIVSYLTNNPDDNNIGWNITDAFIQRLNAGDQDAINRFQASLKAKMVTGKGYYFLVDNVNRLNPPMYKDRGLEVKASNLCFTGDTMVSVFGKDRNPISIKELAELSNGKKRFPVHCAEPLDDDDDEASDIWTKTVSMAVAFKTGTKQVVKVTLSNGDTFRCTPDHELALRSGGWVTAENSVNQTLESWGPDGLTVVSVEEDGIEDVYDLTVDDVHNFFILTSSDGVLVHNCTEINLYSDIDHTFTCILSSMNLYKYDEWKNTDAVFVATVFLDCVAQEFIELSSEIRGLEKAVRFTEKSRALGLGTLGFHSYLQKNMIPFESFDAHLKNAEIFKHLQSESKKASKWMAKKWGEPEWCKGYGVRNTHRLAVAPNTSSALICGGLSQGIEPVYKNVFIQGSAGGEIQRINPIFLKYLKENGLYTKKHMEEVKENQGSVQDVDWLNDHEKEVFKTAFEIDQKVIIRMAAARQRYIDQGQSLNLFFDADEDEEYIAEIHQEAFTNPNIKALYYIRSEAGILASKGECVACEG